jgi:hypothetical protein
VSIPPLDKETADLSEYAYHAFLSPNGQPLPRAVQSVQKDVWRQGKGGGEIASELWLRYHPLGHPDVPLPYPETFGAPGFGLAPGQYRVELPNLGEAKVTLFSEGVVVVELEGERVRLNPRKLDFQFEAPRPEQPLRVATYTLGKLAVHTLKGNAQVQIAPEQRVA